MTFFQLPADILIPAATSDLDALVPSAERERIARLSRQLPLASHAVGYECRLGTSATQVDYNLAFFADAGLSHALDIAARCARPSDGWRRSARLLRAWASGALDGSDAVPFMCAAFDGDVRAEDLPEPCLSFCVDRDFYARRLFADLPGPPPEQVLRVAEAAALHLTEQPLAEDARSMLLRLLEPRLGVAARHLSVMVPRGAAVLKLDVALPLSAIEAYLKALGWFAPWRPASELAARAAGGARHIQLNLPLNPQSDAPLELELLTGRVENMSRRGECVSMLNALGLVSSDKARALLAICERPLIEVEGSFAIGRAFYVKLRYHPDGAMDAKAYLGFKPRYLAGGTGSGPSISRRSTFPAT